MVSNTHLICAQGFYVAIISATVETNEPEKEIQPAIDILGEIMDMFVSISDLYDINEGTQNNLWITSINEGTQNNNNLWITSSYDATSHFETASEEIL